MPDSASRGAASAAGVAGGLEGAAMARDYPGRRVKRETAPDGSVRGHAQRGRARRGFARDDQLGGDRDRNRARMLRPDRDALRADRAMEPGEFLRRSVTRDVAALELRALGLRADQSHVAKVVAG